MRNITKLLTGLSFAMILGLSGATAMAYEVAYLRISGTLLPIEEKSQEGLHNILNVVINGKMQVFRLANVENLKAGGLGREILRHIVPARVTFTGPEDLIHDLARQENAGRRLTITAFLYPVSRTLFVTAVERTDGRIGEEK